MVELEEMSRGEFEAFESRAITEYVPVEPYLPPSGVRCRKATTPCIAAFLGQWMRASCASAIQNIAIYAMYTEARGAIGRLNCTNPASAKRSAVL